MIKFGSEMFVHTAINLKFFNQEKLTRLNCCLPWEERLSSPNHEQRIYFLRMFFGRTRDEYLQRLPCPCAIDGHETVNDLIILNIIIIYYRQRITSYDALIYKILLNICLAYIL